MSRKRQHVAKVEDMKAFLEEFQKETDRGAAVLGAALLDECLADFIQNFLIDRPKEVERLLSGPMAPLGSFDARISAAFCLGLISEDELDDLRAIKSIRNSFAHDLHGISFGAAEIMEQSRSFKTPFSTALPYLHEDARNRFNDVVAMLWSQLRLRTLGLGNERRQVPKAFTLGQFVRVGSHSKK